MAKFIPLLDNFTIDDPNVDFRGSQKVEQYRLGKLALYIPAGFKWQYIPYSAIESVEESHRNICSGKCVTVTEKKPAVDLRIPTGMMKLNFEKSESVAMVLSTL